MQPENFYLFTLATDLFHVTFRIDKVHMCAHVCFCVMSATLTSFVSCCRRRVLICKVSSRRIQCMNEFYFAR